MRRLNNLAILGIFILSLSFGCQPNDTPVINIISPFDDDPESAGPITLEVMASDDIGVEEVRIYVYDVYIGSVLLSIHKSRITKNYRNLSFAKL